MMNNTRPFGIKRNYQYGVEAFYIKLKSMIEYKTNAYSAVTANAIFTLISSLFLGVLYLQFNDIVDWAIPEYIFFFLFYNVIVNIAGVFFYGMSLTYYLKGGSLNYYFTRPINIFMQYLCDNLLVFVIPQFLMYLAICVIFIYNYRFDIDLIKLFLAIPYVILVAIFYFTSYRFFDSIAFFIRENNFLASIYNMTNGTYISYPFPILPLFLQRIGYLFVGAYSTSFLVMYVFGKISKQNFLHLNVLLIILNIILVIGIYLLWHYGLKKYEAYG